MTEAGRCGVFDLGWLGDSLGGIGGVRTYGNSIIHYLRTPQYDALLCDDDPSSQAIQARQSQGLAVCQRIASGELSMKGIIASHALEAIPGDNEAAVSVHAEALQFLSRLIQGGANVRIATSGTHHVISPKAEEFSLIEYQNGRPGELVRAMPTGEHWVVAKEEQEDEVFPFGFERASRDFTTVWEAPTTVQTQSEVMGFLLDVIARIES